MKRKSLVITLIIALIIGILTTSASALSFTATMTPSSTTVAESTEFTITVKVSNLDVGPNGINSLSGYLKYESKVFESITESSIEGLSGWTVSYSSDNGKITLLKSSFVKSDEAVFQIVFKTKSGVSGQSGVISYSNIIASNSESDITASDISTTITVGSNATPVTNTPTTNTPITANTNKTANTNTNTPTVISPVLNQNKNKNNNTNTNSNNNTVPTNTTPQEEMPYTGVEDVALRAIFVVLVIAAISYFKYESMKEV